VIYAIYKAALKVIIYYFKIHCKNKSQCARILTLSPHYRNVSI